MVGNVYEEWLNAVVNRVKESTLANYKAKFEEHILPAFADIPCEELSAGQINELINKKRADGLSANYVRDIITVFKSMLRYAQEEYSFKMSLKNVVLPKAEKKQIEKISDIQQEKLITYLKANISLSALGIFLSLCMGLRIGEICGLKWKDVDFQRKVLHIRWTVQRITSKNGNRKTKIVISSPKSTTSFRDIAIPDVLMKCFEMFRNKDNCFILSGTDKPVEPRTMQYRYKKILQTAEIENHNYHKLRLTFATNCAEHGFDVKTLSIILGHSTINLTRNRYVHPDRTHERTRMLFEINIPNMAALFYRKGVNYHDKAVTLQRGYLCAFIAGGRARRRIHFNRKSKKMLTEYVSKQTGWNLVEIYEDDGYSGTDFNRPGVRQLLDDAKSGKINLILCKDLSRFGRNYIEVGQYVDYVFPSFNIRFIALSDNVDTLERNSTAMDMMPIVNLFNERHAASTSKKIRAVMVSNAKQGKYHAPVAPFGYLVGDTEDRLPVVDETNAPYVRMMYKMRSEGASSPQIAKALNAQGVITPSDYTYKRCLTRELCLDLIEFIVVHARPEDRNAPRRIDIYYKFISKPLADSRNLLLPQNSVEINQS